MLNKKNTIRVSGVLLLLMVFVSVYYLNIFYNRTMEDLNKKIFPTHAKPFGFTLFNAYAKKGEAESGKIYASLKPGEKFTGLLGLKNHDDKESHTFMISVGIADENKKTEGNSSLPVVKLATSDLYIAPENVSFIKYTIEVPKDAKKGTYKTNFSSRIADKNAPKFRQGNIILELAVGVDIRVEVTDNPAKYEYNDLSDQSRSAAWNIAMFRARYIGAILLAIITFTLLYKSYKLKTN